MPKRRHKTFLPDRPPRLVLRFAVITALCLGLGGAAILIFTRHLNTVEAERTAAKHAQSVAEQVLSDSRRPPDFERPVRPARRDDLDRLFSRKVLRPGTVLATLSRRDGLVTYSTDHNLIGQRLGRSSRTDEALSGTVTSEVRRDGDLKVLRTSMPLHTDGRTGVVVIHQDYGP